MTFFPHVGEYGHKQLQLYPSTLVPRSYENFSSQLQLEKSEEIVLWSQGCSNEWPRLGYKRALVMGEGMNLFWKERDIAGMTAKGHVTQECLSSKLYLK